MGRKPVKQRFKVSNKVQLAALGTLAVVTAGVVGAALLDNPTPPASPVIASTGVVAEPTPTVEPTVDAAPQLEAIRAALAGTEPLTISVLGDSTGDRRGEWVDLWAQHLATRGTVTLHLWDGETDNWNPKPVVYPGGERQIVIWNGSKAGSNSLYAAQYLASIQPGKPTFQILSYGHNNATLRADSGAADLLNSLKSKWDAEVPTAITLQNPASGAREVQSAGSVSFLRDWAGRKGYPVIDANKAIADAGNLPGLLLEDGLGVHPNPAGQRIWADTVIATLG